LGSRGQVAVHEGCETVPVQMAHDGAMWTVMHPSILVSALPSRVQSPALLQRVATSQPGCLYSVVSNRLQPVVSGPPCSGHSLRQSIERRPVLGDIGTAQPERANLSHHNGVPWANLPVSSELLQATSTATVGLSKPIASTITRAKSGEIRRSPLLEARQELLRSPEPCQADAAQGLRDAAVILLALPTTPVTEACRENTDFAATVKGVVPHSLPALQCTRGDGSPVGRPLWLDAPTHLRSMGSASELPRTYYVAREGAVASTAATMQTGASEVRRYSSVDLASSLPQDSLAHSASAPVLLSSSASTPVLLSSGASTPVLLSRVLSSRELGADKCAQPNLVGTVGIAKGPATLARTEGATPHTGVEKAAQELSELQAGLANLEQRLLGMEQHGLCDDKARAVLSLANRGLAVIERSGIGTAVRKCLH